MTKINYQQAQFLTSAATFQQCPPDQGKEVAFAGRSNAGKSSALNALANIKSLARTSKLPGRTQLINFFVLNEHTRLVDLPGYGYAKVPEAIKQRWQKTLAHYLEKRESLCGIVLLMDIRHPLKASDEQMLTWASHSHLPVHILLTKADKLSKSAGVKVLQQLKKQINISENISLQLFSALKKTGIEELQKKMDEWLK